jgi:hypothetical protein
MLLPVVLSGPPAHLMGSAQVQQLQQALKNLAVSTQRPVIDPGPATGDINDATMVAVSSAMGLLTEDLPSWAYLTIQGALLAGATSSTAKNMVVQYAPQLTQAINAAAVKFHVNPTPTTTPVVAPSTSLFAPGWWKQPWGIALLAIAAFAVYKVVLAPPSK